MITNVIRYLVGKPEYRIFLQTGPKVNLKEWSDADWAQDYQIVAQELAFCLHLIMDL